jgi:hypothetical protein
MNKLETLNNKKQELKNQIKVINKEIEKLEYDDRYNQLIPFVGKYFIEVDKNENWIRCYFVFELKELKLLSLHVYYFDDSEIYSHIEIQNDFNHIREYEEGLEHYYNEISKDEFMNYYNICLERIKNKVE